MHTFTVRTPLTESADVAAVVVPARSAAEAIETVRGITGAAPVGAAPAKHNDPAHGACVRCLGTGSDRSRWELWAGYVSGGLRQCVAAGSGAAMQGVPLRGRSSVIVAAECRACRGSGRRAHRCDAIEPEHRASIVRAAIGAWMACGSPSVAITEALQDYGYAKPTERLICDLLDASQRERDRVAA